MRIFIFLLTITPILSAHGAKLMSCLGQEEAKLHKSRQDGPIYRLNQLFIDKFAPIGDLVLSKEMGPKICGQKHVAPALLFHLITKEKKIFRTSSKPNRGQIDAVINQVPRIFFRYILDLQSSASDTDCLKKKIPQMYYLLDRYKYLEDMGPERFFEVQKENIKNLLIKMNKIKPIVSLCQKKTKKK